MAKIVVYTKAHCPYCVRAKNLLTAKGVEFEVIDLEDKPDELKALKDRTGLRTVPQIFIDGTLIGGFSELSALDQEGKLDPLIL
jgi:glutaredoxin 3